LGGDQIKVISSVVEHCCFEIIPTKY